jgi:signal transduction histidine kinase
MHWLQTLIDWFAGGDDRYCTLLTCMHRDPVWIPITIALDLAITVGYGIIAVHWWRNERQLPASPARSALANMRNIFVFCSVCGYLFVPVKLVWPAWRLYDIFMVVLVFYTWRYAFSAQGLKVVYSSLGRSTKLAADLAESREESNRKSFFLNAISHDLRTPLNGLLLHASLAELHIAKSDPAAAQNSIDEIKAATRLTADLLDGLLEYARVEGGQDRPAVTTFELDMLLADVLNTHAAAAAAKSLGYRAPAPSGLTMQSDRLKLERILNNLVGNAIKFTSAGEIGVHLRRSGDVVEISVTDTGIGIPVEHHARLFEEFYQVGNRERDRTKGFGLGLAICRKLAEQLGGGVSIQSQPGRGSTFTVTVAITLERREAENSRAAAGISPAAGAMSLG